MAAPVQDPSRADSDDSRADSDQRRGNSDRYEALPSVAALPGWIWRRLPRAAKVALALLALAAIGLVILLSPGIDESKDERRQAESERLSRLREQRVAKLREEQRPRVRRAEPAGADLAARAALLGTVRTAVERDARRRVAAGTLEGPIRRVSCERYPRSLDDPGAHLDPARSAGRYSCLAITADVPGGEGSGGAAIGHPYRVRIDFASGRYAFCKVSGRPGEGSIDSPLVTVPRVCGGR